MQHGLIQAYASVFNDSDAAEILKSQALGEQEPTVGGYAEYTINLHQAYRAKVETCVQSYLKSYEIDFNYCYKCSRLANITDVIHRHSDSVVNLEPKHDIRDFIVISYLTQFDAGEIIFPQHGLIFKPELGDTLIFPTGPFFQHLVNTTMGERIIMRSEYYQNLDSFGSKVDRTIWK